MVEPILKLTLPATHIFILNHYILSTSQLNHAAKQLFQGHNRSAHGAQEENTHSCFPQRDPKSQGGLSQEGP